MIMGSEPFAILPRQVSDSGIRPPARSLAKGSALSADAHCTKGHNDDEHANQEQAGDGEPDAGRA